MICLRCCGALAGSHRKEPSNWRGNCASGFPQFTTPGFCIGISNLPTSSLIPKAKRITDFGIAGLEAEIAQDNLRTGTPAYMSPEMIAASPKKGVLRPKVALACFAFFVAAALSIVYIQGFYKFHNLIPFDKSPEALAENVKRMIKSFGYTEKPADIKYHITPADSDFIDWAAKNEAMSNTAERL